MHIGLPLHASMCPVNGCDTISEFSTAQSRYTTHTHTPALSECEMFMIRFWTGDFQLTRPFVHTLTHTLPQRQQR